MKYEPIWKKLSRTYLDQQSLQRVIRSLKRCKSMTEKEKEDEEWALTLQWAYDNGYI